MKKIIFAVFLFVICFCSVAFADQMTLVTYYPAPFGMYEEMRVMGYLGVGTTYPGTITPSSKAKVYILDTNGVDDPAADGLLVAGDAATYAKNHSVAFGGGVHATGYHSVAMGYHTTASGNDSIAMGTDTTASGVRAIAMGHYTTASGELSTATGVTTTASGKSSTTLGAGTTASGEGSIAIGTAATTASGNNSIAMGATTTASGRSSTTLGVSTTASGDYSTAMGSGTTASGNNSIAMGATTTASGEYSTAMGIGTTASGYASTAMGIGTTAQQYSSMAIGRYNVVGGGTPTSWIDGEPLFAIGNGASNTQRANAVTVLKNGRVGIGTTTPRQKLEIIAGGAYNLPAGICLREGSSATDYGMFLDASSGGYASIQSFRNTATLGIVTPAPLLVQPLGGSVGIGTSAPVARLDVNGAIKTNASVWGGGNHVACYTSTGLLGYCSGAPTGSGTCGCTAPTVP